MPAFADFTYFGLLLYIVVPTILLGLFGWANARWVMFASALVGVVQFSNEFQFRPGVHFLELWVLLGFAAWQAVVAFGLLRWKSRWNFRIALVLSLLPLAAAKWLPHLAPQTALGFAGISYVTFRALDVIFSIHDGVLKSLSLSQYFTFLLFFPTISSGPIDRYRRFTQDLAKKRTRSEFLDDLDVAVERVFRGFLYKFIIAALIQSHWMSHVEHGGGWRLISYMYAYTFYLFFDFAGYSSFAIGFSRMLGIKTPENFDLPFLARNIRDFWNRWHISLSFWFRDHIYMRFLLAAAKGKWFKGKFTANYVGLYLTFGLMGIWHGTETYYLIYGVYHATLLSAYDWFARWNKQKKVWGDGPVQRGVDLLLTFHSVAFGLLLFSGRLSGH